jgi:hypothetical protein
MGATVTSIHRVAVLIGTGIGVTPWGSVLKVSSLLSLSAFGLIAVQNIMCALRGPYETYSQVCVRRYMQQKRKLGALRRVEFIWCVKLAEMRPLELTGAQDQPRHFRVRWAEVQACQALR